MTKETKPKNKGGRPKGSQNTVTVEAKAWISGLMHSNAIAMNKEFLKLSPKHKFDVLTGLLPYIIPRQQQVEVKSDDIAMFAEGVENLRELFKEK